MYIWCLKPWESLATLVLLIIPTKLCQIPKSKLWGTWYFFFLFLKNFDHPPRNLRLLRPASEELVIMESPPAVKHMDLGDPKSRYPCPSHGALGRLRMTCGPWPFGPDFQFRCRRMSQCGCGLVKAVLTRSEFSKIFPLSIQLGPSKVPLGCSTATSDLNPKGWVDEQSWEINLIC